MTAKYHWREPGDPPEPQAATNDDLIYAFERLYPFVNKHYIDHFEYGHSGAGYNTKISDVYYRGPPGNMLGFNDRPEITKGVNDHEGEWGKILHYHNFPFYWRRANKATIEDIPVSVDDPKSIDHISDFMLHTSENTGFMSSLPSVSKKVDKDVMEPGPEGKIKGPSSTDITDAYHLATWHTGISKLNIDPETNPKVVISIVRYHIYFTMVRYLNNKDYYNDKILKYGIKLKIPKVGVRLPLLSNGITEIGLDLLQESIESMIYSVLGAQANTRWPIATVTQSAQSLQTQEIFRNLVVDTVIVGDVNSMITNMRQAIGSTNVLLDTAITPGVILVPSNMIIQDEKVDGYNNILTNATKNMVFGTSMRNTARGSGILSPPRPPREETPSSREATPDSTTTGLPVASVGLGDETRKTEIEIAIGVLFVAVIVFMFYSRKSK